jgi:hypothetical protein
VDQPRVIGRGLKQRRECGSGISQPPGYEMREDEFDGQRLLLEDGDAGNRCATWGDNVVSGAGVRRACAIEGAFEIRSAIAATETRWGCASRRINRSPGTGDGRSSDATGHRHVVTPSGKTWIEKYTDSHACEIYGHASRSQYARDGLPI